jgi:hypothetical protein
MAALKQGTAPDPCEDGAQGHAQEFPSCATPSRPALARWMKEEVRN